MLKDRSGASEPIAVVGMALRVPGADSLEQFWQNILNGRDSLTRPSIDELRSRGVSRRQLKDPNFVRAEPLISDIEHFDASFFDMTGFEAERTEPAHRLFLECAWEALESAGIVPGRKGPSVGVFGGPEGFYRQDNLSHLDEPPIDQAVRVQDRGRELPQHLGTSPSYYPSRVSYKLDLTGPSFSIVAACSTSLIALELATESVRRRECGIAIAGGSSVMLPHVGGYISTDNGMLSPSGRVRPFDAHADGTVFGSGAGVVVLRPLDDAISEGNPIWGVVRGCGSSNDGNPPGKQSYIAPSPEGQVAAIEAAFSDAGVSADSIGYLEAHGTATRRGDPTEVASATEVFRRDSSSRGYCALGSVKANVGHLRMAAGVVSVIKACLALKHRTLPPLTNFTESNPEIDLVSSPFFVSNKASTWNDGPSPRRVAVSAFGFGGANAHAVLEEYVEASPASSSRRLHLFPVSAKSGTALARRISDLATHLDANPGLPAADVAHTLQCGRAAMSYRACFRIDEGGTTLPTQLLQSAPVTGVAETEHRPVVFLFPGQGAQRPGMGREAYDRERLYREIVDHCAVLLEPELGLDIRSLLHTTGESSGGEVLRRTANAQPALFVVGYALAKQFMAWGVKPQAMLGHSIGEIVAACVAEVFSLEDALTLVAARARLMQACDPGAMAAIFLSEERLSKELAGENLEIAAVNAPEICVVSGAEADLSSFMERMQQANIGVRRIETSHAFHSRMMEPALPAFREVLQEIELNAPKIPVISNATGVALTDEQATNPSYWSDHVRQTVRFSPGAEYLLRSSDQVFLELGPGRTLCDLIRQHNAAADTFAALEQGSPTEYNHSALQALEELWCAGGTVNWQSFYGDEPRRKLVLPTYPFERRRYWLRPGEFETQPDEGLFLYEPGWRLDESGPVASEADARPWLIFCDQHGIGTSLAETLRMQGQTVITLLPNDKFAELGRDTFAIRPASKDDLLSALATVRARDSGLAPLVVHMWSVTGNSGDHNSIEAFKRANRTGFYTLIALTQAAHDSGMTEGLDVLVVADGLRQIDGEHNPLHAEKGALLGPVRNVAKEMAAITFRCADISGFDEQPVDQLSNGIAAEASRRDRQSVVCLRANNRYVEELFPLAEPPLGRLRLRDRGTVLITGGVGGLGLKIASMLFETAQARLVLTSRWEPPPKEEWATRAQQDDKIGRALRESVELERRGAELLVVKVDMGDIGSLKAAMAQAQSRFGSIHGVVHAAGINTDGPAINTVPEIAEPAFEAKVYGAFNLEEALKDTPLDFFVYFSSRSSYTPALGQTIYTTSNSVLDMLSHKRSLKQPGLNCAIGWGAWQEIGMAVAMAEGKIRDPKGSVQHERQHRVDRVLDHPLLDGMNQASHGSAIYWSRIKDGDHWICEHRFKGRAVIAGVTILECLRASYVDLLETGNAIELSQIAFIRPIFVEDQGTDIEIEYTPLDAGHRFEVRSRPVGHSGGWTINTVGRAARVGQPPAEAPQVPDGLPTTGFRPGIPEGFSLGYRWDCILGTKVDGDTIWARAHLGESFRADADSFGLHPATFDRALNDPSKIFGVLGVPYALDRIRIHDRLGAEYFVRSTRRALGPTDAFDAVFVDGDGNVLVETEGFVSREVEGSSLSDMQTGVGNDPEVRRTGLAPNERIVVTRPGSLDSLKPREFETPAPREGEIRVDVVAAGLNFRDLLSALGQLPVTTGESGPRVGSECSGIVTAVGEGVFDFQPGDPVVALVRDAFSGTVTVNADLVMPVPRSMSMEDAAGVPIVFLTADYAINTLAGLKKGERILIHAAAGGVGLAAVQLAQKIGAEIFATAGHSDKRAHLKELGVEHVMDSRSLDFVQETRELTNGEGVDVVLNSLAGEYIPAGLSLLRYRGRFLEIGKRDILGDSQIGLLPFRNNLAYHAIDLGPMIERRDPMLVDLFDSLMLRFARGDLSPIPTDVIPIADIGGAMQRMARAEHIGKIVLKVRDDPHPWRSIFKNFQELYGRGVPIDQGLAMFRRLLSANQVPHYVMATGTKLDEVGRYERRIGIKAGTRPNLSTDYQSPTTDEEHALTRIWESALGIAPIGVDDDFFDLGGDSITAIQVQYFIADQFGMNLSTSLLIEFPTIAKIGKHIRDMDKRAAQNAPPENGRTAHSIQV